MVLWHTQKHRPILGAEKCSVQGIPISREIAKQFSSELLGDIAGNSFCSFAIFSIFISLFLVLAKKDAAADPAAYAAEDSAVHQAAPTDEIIADMADLLDDSHTEQQAELLDLLADVDTHE